MLSSVASVARASLGGKGSNRLLYPPRNPGPCRDEPRGPSNSVASRRLPLLRRFRPSPSALERALRLPRRAPEEPGRSPWRRPPSRLGPAGVPGVGRPGDAADDTTPAASARTPGRHLPVARRRDGICPPRRGPRGALYTRGRRGAPAARSDLETERGRPADDRCRRFDHAELESASLTLRTPT